jgi:catechol 2,3-dioxygenase-like lactoylglutathione lyase family enzyme
MGFIVGLDHVTIQIDDGDEALRHALRFYVELLGLAPLDRPTNTDNGRPGAWLACGPQQLHIITGAGASAENRVRGAIRRFASPTSKGCASGLRRWESRLSLATAFLVRSASSCAIRGATGSNLSSARQNRRALRQRFKKR